jgi:hypothetical protein
VIPRASAMSALRLTIFMLGLGALCWAWLALPALRTASAPAAISARILAGEPFLQDDLERQTEEFAAAPAFAVPYASIQGAGSILELRLLEMAIDRADPVKLDAQMSALSASLRGALAFRPSDALVWTFLYWLESMRDGIGDRTRGYLAFSYALSPLEGIVALRRSRFGLSNFDQLSGATQEKVVSEFAGMLDARFMDLVAGNLTGPGWLHRDRLLAGSIEVDISTKRALAKLLFSQGIRLNIPGLIGVEERSW